MGIENVKWKIDNFGIAFGDEIYSIGEADTITINSQL